jgi:hypothetical protein
VLPRTIPIHADFVVGVGFVSVEWTFKWTVGAGNQVVSTGSNRNIYIVIDRGGATGVETAGELGFEYRTQKNIALVWSSILWPAMIPFMHSTAVDYTTTYTRLYQNLLIMSDSVVIAVHKRLAI